MPTIVATILEHLSTILLVLDTLTRFLRTILEAIGCAMARPVEGLVV